MPPTDWPRRKIRDLAAVVTGGTPTRCEPSYWGGDVPWMSSGEVHNRNIWDTKEKITEAGLQASNARWIPEGTVMIALNGQGKTRGTVALLRRPVTCNQSLAGIVSGHDLDPEFLRYSLEARYSALRSLTGDESRSGLNLELVRSIEVLVPPLGEQRKIAAILSSIDDVVASSRRVLAQLLTVKRTLRLDLLAKGKPGSHEQFRATEIGDVPTEWAVTQLEDVVEILDSRRRPLNSRERSVMPGDFPYYGANGIVDRIDRWIFDEPLLLVAEDGGYFDEFATRQIAYLVDGKCWINNHAHVLRVKASHDRRWVFYCLVHRDIQPYINAGTRSKLNQADLRRIPIPLPEPDEQRRICDFLDLLEHRAQAEEEFLNGVENVKAGLLGSLLSGEARVTPDEAAA